jgi:hypothetical protein
MLTHNLKVVGSNPTPATKSKKTTLLQSLAGYKSVAKPVTRKINSLGQQVQITLQSTYGTAPASIGLCPCSFRGQATLGTMFL